MSTPALYPSPYQLSVETLSPPPILDVTQAPYFADPTGEVDCTQALIAALDTVLQATLDAYQETLGHLDELEVANGRLGLSCENRKQDGASVCIFPQTRPCVPTIYLPTGQYLVSDTITYTLDNLQNSFGSELCWQIRFRGDGPDKTTIRLRDYASGFSVAKPVVSFFRGRKSNVAMSNYFEGIGLYTGSGNPGAVGLDFFANNSGAVRHVKVVSGDGTGAIGLQLGHANYSGIFIKDLEVKGFDYGCHFDSQTRTMYFAAEHLKISDARLAGIYVGAISASVRDLSYGGSAPGLVCGEDSGHVVLVDSVLRGTGKAAIDYRAGVLYADSVHVEGFERTFSANGETNGTLPIRIESGQMIKELVLPRRCDDHATSPVGRLPICETPLFTPTREGTTSGIREFGALGDGQNDDTEAIQAALDSGANEVIFEPGRYRISRSILIPASVERLSFGFADLVAAEPLQNSAGIGAFKIVGDSDQALVVEDLFAWEAWCGSHVMFDHASTRTLVLSDLHTQTLPLYINSVPGGCVFIENVATTAGVVPGSLGHGRCCLRFTGQRVWARQINPERGDPMMINDGGDLWVLGFKSEDEGVAVQTVNGGRTEILGGILNGGAAEAVAFLGVDSQLRLSAASNGWEVKRHFGTVVREKRAMWEQVVKNQECVSRRFPTQRGPQISLSLYSSPPLKR